MNYEREIKTSKLSRADAEALHGSMFDETGRAMTVEEIMANPSLGKITHARDIRTGEVKPADERHNRTGIPHFVIKVGG